MTSAFQSVFALLILTTTLSFGTQARSYGEGDSEGGGSASGLSNSLTNRVVRTLTREGEACQRLEKVYRFDCYRQAYKLSINVILGNNAYKDAVKALMQVERTLQQVVTQNVERTAPVKRRGLQTYRAIKPSAVRSATVQSERAMRQAQTVLLRSEAGKRTHYAKIAQAVESNKVLLRSAAVLRRIWQALVARA